MINSVQIKHIFVYLIFSIIFISASTVARGEENAKSSVELDIPLSYGKWRINSSAVEHKGKSILSLTEGSHSIKGDFNWQLDFTLTEGNIIPEKIVPGNYGRDLSGLFCYGKKISIPDPKGMRVVVSVPESRGKYNVKGILPEGSGDRAFFLPEGESILLGNDWAIKLKITDKKIHAAFKKNEDEEKAEISTENGVLQVSGNIVLWKLPEQKEDREVEKEDSLKLILNRDKNIFRRDEYMLLSVYIQNNAVMKDTLTISALQGEDEHVFFTQGWSVNPGSNTRSFEIPLYLLKAGKYSLKARFSYLEAEHKLEVTPSFAELERGVFIACSKADKNTSLLSEKGVVASFVTGKDIANDINKNTTSNLASIIHENNKQESMRGIAGTLMQAREFKPAETFLADIDICEDNNSLFDWLKNSSPVSDNKMKIATKLPLQDFLKNKVLHNNKNIDRFYLAGPKGISAGEIINIFKDNKNCAFCKTIFEVDQPSSAWLALMLGAKGVLSGEVFDEEFTSSWKKFSPAIKKIMADYLKNNPLPVYSVSEDKNTVLFAEDSEFISYRLVYSRAKQLVKLPLSLGKNYVYEVTTNWEIPAPDMSMNIGIEMEKDDFKFFIYTPAKPSRMECVSRVVSTADYPYAVRVYAKMIDENNRLCRGIFPAQVVLENESGIKLATLNGAFENGILDIYYPLASNNTDGKITARVKSCNVEAESSVIYTQSLRNFSRRIRERSLLEIEDKDAVRTFIQNNDKFTIVVGSVGYLESAQMVQRYLQSYQNECEIKFINEVTGEKFSGEEKLTNMPSHNITGNLILIGSPSDNKLIDSLANKYRLTPYRIDNTFPGSGKGIIQYCWRAFSSNSDTLLISGTDIAGIHNAARRFASGRGY